MDSTTATLLTEIDTFLANAALTETTFGRLAVNDGKFVGRLREGGRVWPETAEKVRQFIASQNSAAA